MIETHIPAVLMPAECGAGAGTLDHELLVKKMRARAEKRREEIAHARAGQEGRQGREVPMPVPEKAPVLTATDIVAAAPHVVVGRL